MTKTQHPESGQQSHRGAPETASGHPSAPRGVSTAQDDAREAAAALLVEHFPRWSEDGYYEGCMCGGGADESSLGHESHQAEELAAAGFLATINLPTPQSVELQASINSLLAKAEAAERAWGLTRAPFAATVERAEAQSGWDEQTRERVARALLLWRTSGLCEFGKVCELCDCFADEDGGQQRDAHMLGDADAVLAVLPSPDGLAEQVRALADDWEQAAQPVDDRHGRTVLDRVYQAHADDLRALLDSEGGQDRG